MRPRRGLLEIVGRRGAVLLFLCLLDILVGYSYVTQPKSVIGLNLLLSPITWGWVWIVVGCILFVGAFLKRDRAFYALSVFMKTAWAGAWVSVWINDPQVSRAWVSVVIWASFAALVLLISTWPEVHTFRPNGTGRG